MILVWQWPNVVAIELGPQLIDVLRDSHKASQFRKKAVALHVQHLSLAPPHAWQAYFEI